MDSTEKKMERASSSASPLPLSTFHPFPSLAPELRQQIWTLLLPAPRALQVTKRSTYPVTYTTAPCSYGGAHSVLLSINRESRAEALKYLKLKFRAYWNLKTDALYIQVKQWGACDAAQQLADMKREGALEGFENLALDLGIWSAGSEIWSERKVDHCMTTIRNLPNIKTCAMIMNSSDLHKAILTPGQSWYIRPVESEQQTAFKTHESWCPAEFVAKDLVDHKDEWQKRGRGLNFNFCVIEGRTLQSLPFCPLMYEPPGMDFFG